MSILDAFLNGSQEKNRGHFANIVKIAKSDGKLSEDELLLLTNIKRQLNINDGDFINIIKNPGLYPMSPPVELEERIERLYVLVKMVIVDQDTDISLETKMLKKLAIGIGFSLAKHELVVDKAIQLELLDREIDMDTFITEIKKVKAAI